MKKWSNIFKRKTCIGLFVVVFLLAGIFIVENRVAHAENAPYVDSSTDFISEEKDVSTDGGVPVASGEYADWLFAGWYSEQTCKDESVISNTTDVTKAWAKFVPADVLTVKCQVKSDVQSEGVTSTNMRLITSVDTLNYNKVGFKVIYNNGAEKDVWTQTVYSRIKASAESGVDYNYSPKVVDTKSEWFVTATLVNINQNNYGKEFLIKPYWVTYDGTTVYGTSKYVTVADSYSDVVSLPVKVDSEATLNSLSVTGETIKEIRYSENGAGWGAIVLTEDKSALPSLTKYTISDGQVAYWRNLNTVYNGDNADKSWYEAISDEKEFVIATNADLYGMATDVTKFAGKTIYLCADIEANKGTATADGWDTSQVEGATEYNWPTTFQKFDGTFDGQGHTIEGVCAKISYRAALFQHIGPNGVVQNFKLLNSYMDGINYNGSIAGRLDGVIRDVTSDAIVKGSSYIHGGFVGITYASTNTQALIENCEFSGSVYSPANYVGGMVGSRCLGNLKIVDCEVTGNVNSSKNYAGGILGGLYDLSSGDTTINTNTVGKIEIENCKFQGQLTGGGECLGGILGATYNRKETITIKDCTVAGTLTGGYNFGGVTGYTGTGTTNISGCTVTGNMTTAVANSSLGGVVGTVGTGTTNVEKCTVSGTLTAGNYFGGIIGRIPNGQVNVKACAVTSTLQPSSTNIGGIIGYITGATSNVKITDDCYFAGKIETSTARSNSGGLVGSIWNSATLNITDCHANSMTAPGDYSGGLVGAVVNATANIDSSYFDGTFSTKNIYSGGLVGYSSGGTVNIGKNSYFDGTFSTTNLYAGGLVGYATASTVKISESHFKGTFDTKVPTGDWAYAGGLFGYVIGGGKSDIENSYFDGTLNSTKAGVGGLVGFVTKDTSGATAEVTISRCYSKGAIKGQSSHTGGIVGGATYLMTEVSLTDCLNEASVTGTAWVGGLLGRTHISNTTTGNIQMTRCLNIGTISTTSGSTSVGSAIGKAEIKAPVVTSTYAVTTDTVKQAYGTGSTTCGVTTCTLPEITVGNGVTAEKIRTETLSGLFTAENTIWTIGTTEGSTPKLDLTK